MPSASASPIHSKQTIASSMSLTEASDLEVAVSELAKNYAVLRSQTTQGFILTAIFMSLGVLVILAGSVGDLFGFKTESSNLTTVSGVIVESISGIGMYLFNRTFRSLNVASERLLELWRLLAAFKSAEGLPESHRTEVLTVLINKLVEPPAKT
jgi:MFS family permease